MLYCIHLLEPSFLPVKWYPTDIFYPLYFEGSTVISKHLTSQASLRSSGQGGVLENRPAEAGKPKPLALNSGAPLTGPLPWPGVTLVPLYHAP